METQEIIFTLFITGVVIYSLIFYIRRFGKFRNRKYLKEKYPDGFICNGVAYTFFGDAESDFPLPDLDHIDLKIFDSSDIQDGGLVKGSVL